MEKSRVTSKGQTVIPKPVRKALGIKEGTELAWSILGHTITVVPIPEDPIRALKGILKGMEEISVEDLLKERQEDQELEEAKWRRLGYEP